MNCHSEGGQDISKNRHRVDEEGIRCTGGLNLFCGCNRLHPKIGAWLVNEVDFSDMAYSDEPSYFEAMATSPLKAATKRIENALTRSARSRTIPDYTTFQIFMAPLLERERSMLAANVHADLAPYATASMMLLSRYHQRLIKGRHSPMDFRRYKLLRSLFSDNGRGEQMAKALLHGSLPDDPTLDTDQVSPTELRMRLIAAIHSGDFDDASFLLGRLEEVDHDPGERAYLQAMASFAAGRYERTIKLVVRVPADAIDRPRAAWLAAKASAILGRAPMLDELLDEIGDRLTPCAWLHLIELLNLTNEGQEFAGLMRRLPATLNVMVSDEAYDEWALYHTLIMGRIKARDREIVEASAATGEIPSENEIAADQIFKSYMGTFFVEHKLRGHDEVPNITQWLHPVIAKGSVSAFRTAVETMADASDHTGIVALAKQFPSCPGLLWQRELDIVAAVFGAASIADDRIAKRLKRSLAADRLELAETNAQRSAIAAGLTPMGRISYLASAAELASLQQAGDTWRDCGLIALGLFRAIEVELNARLVRPLAARLDVQTLTSQLAQNGKALRASLNKLAGLTGSDGLMLGDIRALLASFSRVDDDDTLTAGVRDQVRTGFEALLSEAGRRAPALEDIAIMIGPVAVGRFRNPPAHGQFLRLADAIAALEHADDALDKLTRWLPNHGNTASR